MIKAKDFNTREELEKFVTQKYGQTTELKDDVISGTRKELKKLFLDDTKRVWGIPCEITDEPTEPTLQKARIERGEIHTSKINNVTKKRKNVS